jgi:16S rRNA (guanine527-N7)-methyltransferase
VKQSVSLEEYFSFLEAQKLPLTNEQQWQFGQYLDLLLFWSKKQNLISHNDIQYIVERHFLPSSFLVTFFPHLKKRNIVDVGTGAGFPGMVLAIMMPENLLTLIDSSRKKYLFLKETCEVLGIKAELKCERVESFARENNSTFDYVVSRAVASLEILWFWSEDLLKNRGKMIAMKGGNLDEEISNPVISRKKIKLVQPEPEWVQFSETLANKKYLIVENKSD